MEEAYKSMSLVDSADALFLLYFTGGRSEIALRISEERMIM